MASPPLSNSSSRRNSYDSYGGSSGGPSLEDREAVLSLNLKDDYFLPHSLYDINTNPKNYQRTISDASDVQEDREKRINEAIEHYKEKYKMKYRTRYKWKYRELLKHMETRGEVGAQSMDTNPDADSAGCKVYCQGAKIKGPPKDKYRDFDFKFSGWADIFMILFWVSVTLAILDEHSNRIAGLWTALTSIMGRSLVLRSSRSLN
ncbi:hypothetical protein TWF481_009824 [Arthrobotrys musiformis]|uniref:Uncharacterized protein n=1 Tax=Arthrobotrys musiformis TaxID=47236 RepID=A0AAV9W4Y0_9PEZI